MEKMNPSQQGRQLSMDDGAHDTAPLQGKFLSPPPFQLIAAPIQRVVNNEDGDEADINELFDFLIDNEIEVKESKKKIQESFELEGTNKKGISFQNFVDTYLTRKNGKEVFEEPCQEEKQGSKVKRTTAPKEVRDRVYGKDPSNPKFIGEDKKTGHSKFACIECGKELELDKNGKELGYQNKYGDLFQPPVGHGNQLPADYIIRGIEEIVRQQGLDPSLIKHSEAKKIMNEMEWEIGVEDMAPSHTKCNLKKKDTRWDDLPKKVLKERLDKIETHIKSKKRKGKSLTILEEICNAIKKFNKKDDQDDGKGGGGGGIGNSSLVNVVVNN
jgi:hypothetical protein